MEKPHRLQLLIIFGLLSHGTEAIMTEWFPDRIRDPIWNIFSPKLKGSIFDVDNNEPGRSDLVFEPSEEIATDKYETTTILNPLNEDNGSIDGSRIVGLFDLITPQDDSFASVTVLPQSEDEGLPSTVLGILETTPSTPEKNVITDSLFESLTSPITEDNSAPATNSSSMDEQNNLRLPNTMRPIHYTIKLQPFINSDLSIHGFMEVEIEVLNDTSEITLHAFDIECKYDAARLQAKDDIVVAPRLTTFVVDTRRQFLTATLDGPLLTGKRYMYSMNYSANLTDQPKGFFTTSYVDNGEERRLAATIFQPTYARRAFPCFDEPAMKATFDIYLAREIRMSSISNMPLRSSTVIPEQDGWVLDQFETTPPMSTYLVIFVVSELEFVSSTIEDRIPIQVWSRADVLDGTEFTLQLAKEVTIFFEKKFKIPYPLPKIDVIALPISFPFAFEGWGAVVCFSEEMAIFSSNNSLPSAKHRIAMIQAHELAHQWFGNLVTPLWWTDLWLNEGFASYMENVALAHIKPEWDIEEHQILKDLHSVFRLDSHLSSHPISIPVYRPEEIMKIFDRISYEKGSSLIRMMNHFLTMKTFDKGITNFLSEHKFDGADQDDLWKSLTMAGYEDGTLPSDLTVKDIMDSWTLKMGYPVVNVVRNSDGCTATVFQERFLTQEEDPGIQEYKWYIPLTYTSQENPNFTNTESAIWMMNSSSPITLDGLPSSTYWVMFNLQQTGFYRVNYDNRNWDLLSIQLQSNHKMIGTINRAQLIDDALNLALAGRISYITALNITKYLKMEEDFAVWDSVLGNIGFMNEMLSDTNAHESFKRYILSLLLPLYQLLGFNAKVNEPYIHQMKRPELLKWACDFGHEDCIGTATSIYRTRMVDTLEDNDYIEDSTMRYIYCTAIENGGLKEWEFAWRQYRQTNIDKIKDDILKALSCNKQTRIRARFLDMVFEENNGMRGQDTFQVFQELAARQNKNNTVWRYLQKHWPKITKLFGDTQETYDVFVSTSTKHFKTQQELHELKVFKNKHENNAWMKEAIEKAIKRTQDNIRWIERNYDVINTWLDEQHHVVA